MLPCSAVRAPIRVPVWMLLALALLAGCRTVEDMQRDYAKKITPHGVEAAPVADTAPEKALRPMKVRVWVDGDYQRQTLHWEERIQAQFDRANRVLVPQFGVRLDVVEMRSWDNQPADALDVHLRALRGRDDGQGVDWVVGYVSSVERVATSHDLIGMAAIFGKHLVMRGLVSIAETDAIHASLDRLSPSELDRVTRERRLHKETATLLHEWAHTLGAVHERSPEWLMSPVMDVKQVSFSVPSIRVIAAGLDFRGSSTAALLKAWAREYRAAIDAYPQDLLTAETRQWALGATASLADGSYADVAVATAGDTPAVLRTAQAKVQAGDLAGAWSLVEPLARASKEDPLVQSYACQLAAQRAVRAPDTLTLCRAAVSLPRSPPETRLALAHVHLALKESLAASEVLGPLEESLAKGPDRSTDMWLALGQSYQRVGALTAAERAAGKAGSGAAVQQLVRDCRHERRRLGVYAIDPANEVAYLEAMRSAQGEIERGRTARARAIGRDLQKRFPGAPGPALVDCLVEAKASSVSRTQAACARAASASAELIEPHYWLGLVALQQNRWPEARAELGKACELDDSGDTWWKVAGWYQQAGDMKALADTREKYRARFGRELRAAR